MARRRLITEMSFYPDGCDPDDPDASSFRVIVQWRGAGRYAVLGRSTMDCQLSRAGKWKWCPLPMARRQYRFTFEEACDWAERVVDEVIVGGQTWKQWTDEKRQLVIPHG